MRRDTSILDIDEKLVVDRIVRFLKFRINSAKLSKYVLGVSGGVDSAVVAALAARAVEPRNVIGIRNPIVSHDSEASRLGQIVIDTLNIDGRTVDLSLPYIEFCKAINTKEDPIAFGNLRNRLRMSSWYHMAYMENGLVLNTGNLTENVIGYFTKYGDGAGDIAPIRDLYKHHVWQLARYLKIPDEIINTPPSAGFWKDQTDEIEIGIDYGTLDLIVHGLSIMQSASDIARKLDISLDLVQKIKTLNERSEHKRRGPIGLKLGFRSPCIDWRQPSTS